MTALLGRLLCLLHCHDFRGPWLPLVTHSLGDGIVLYRPCRRRGCTVREWDWAKKHRPAVRA